VDFKLGHYLHFKCFASMSVWGLISFNEAEGDIAGSLAPAGSWANVCSVLPGAMRGHDVDGAFLQHAWHGSMS
jgi:hypothetical protein